MCCLLHWIIRSRMNTALFFFPHAKSQLSLNAFAVGTVAKERTCLQCQMQPKLHTEAHKNGKEPKRGFATFIWPIVVQMGKILDLHIVNLVYSYQKFWSICLYMALQRVYAQPWERRFSDHHRIPSYGAGSRIVQNQKRTHGYLEINCIRQYNWCYFSSLKFLQE